MKYAGTLAKPRYRSKWRLRATISGEIIENDKDDRRESYGSLHNSVDIKIGIIYKNRKNNQKPLQFVQIRSIVFMQCEYLEFLCPTNSGFRNTPFWLFHIFGG